MLTDIDEQYVPLGVARYIASIQNLEVRPRGASRIALNW